ncbi:MAG: hypothetical protein HDS79_05405 [Bacteroidales bacterium]|nr:hypothetical protein [Bacteroidales bacterium]
MTLINFNRLKYLWEYHYPMVKHQLFLYFVISVLVAILTLLPLPAQAQISIFAIGNSILGYLVVLSPIVLAKNGDTRIVERLIPATAAEKFTWRIIYFLIIIPIFCYVYPYLSNRLYFHIPEIQTALMTDTLELAVNNSFRLKCLNILSTLLQILICLYVVTYARKSRIIKAVLSVFATQLVFGLIGFIWGISETTGLLESHSFPININKEEIQSEIMDRMVSSSYIWSVTLLMACASLTMLWLNYRVLKKRNL